VHDRRGRYGEPFPLLPSALVTLTPGALAKRSAKGQNDSNDSRQLLAERAGFETAFPASPSASAEPPSDVKTEANAIAHDEVSTTVDADTRRSDPTPADEDPKVLIRRAIQAHLARGEDAQAMALMALLSPTAPPTEAAPSPSLRALPGGKAAK
jgi:hypothetical protein